MAPQRTDDDLTWRQGRTDHLETQALPEGQGSVGGPMQGRTDNSWGPRAIGDHGSPVSLPKLKKAYEKGTSGISWGPLLILGPRGVPEFPNGQSAPGPVRFPWYLFHRLF
ncbi:unnamed protein product [Staurois parvus]|uniref:Uncharacterized protein n=1 Tax=Staurois parvus TaxID=386267 RepID=A0ABN9HMC6_9NEOB|nr:unnamed protein product [Staurois parvus]